MPIPCFQVHRAKKNVILGFSHSLISHKNPTNCTTYTFQSILSLEKEMETHSSILAWRIPWTEELAGNSPWGCKKLHMTEQLSTSTSKIHPDVCNTSRSLLTSTLLIPLSRPLPMKMCGNHLFDFSASIVMPQSRERSFENVKHVTSYFQLSNGFPSHSEKIP